MGTLNTVEMLVEEQRLHFDVDPGAESSDDKTLVSRRVFSANSSRLGLALSGGGVRSATFALGVLQALSSLRLLTSIDYLSTVSGGGYSGSWLSAWAHRHPAGIAGVMEELSARPSVHEALPIRHLRRFSNYLTPRTGLLSADTWTIVGTYLRNLLVNWLTLVPYFLLVLLLPLVLVELLRTFARLTLFRTVGVLNLAPADLMLAGGLACLVVAIMALAASVPTATSRGEVTRFGLAAGTQEQFLLKALGPLNAGALALAAWWAWYATAPAGVALLLSASAPVLPQWAVFTLLGLGAHLAAWALYTVRTRRYQRWTGWGALARGDDTGRWIELLAVVISGGVGGFIIWLLATKVVPTPFLGPSPFAKPLELYLIASVPSFLLGFLLAATLYVALGSPRLGDEDREWFARAGAWVLAVAVGWLVIGTITLLGPDILDWLWAHGRSWTVSIGGISGIVSMWLGRSDRTAAHGEERPTTWSDLAAEWALTLAAPVFTVILAILGASGLRWMLDLLVSLWSLDALAAVATIGLGLLLVILIVISAVNINVFSLHGVYRDRLIRAYLGASRSQRNENQFTGFDPDDNIEMAHLVKPFFSARDWPLVHTIASVLDRPESSSEADLRAAIVAVDPRLVAAAANVGESPADKDAAVHGILNRFNYVLSASNRAAEVRAEWEAAVRARFPLPQFGPHEWSTLAALAQELHPDHDRVARSQEIAARRFDLQALISRRDAGWIADAAAAPVWNAKAVVDLTCRFNSLADEVSMTAAGRRVTAAASRVASVLSPATAGDAVEGKRSDVSGSEPAELLRGMVEEIVPKGKRAPLHIVNAAINLVAGDELAWQERRSASFTFTPLHAGSPCVGYRSMVANKAQPMAYGGPSGVSLGSAITISGAAANPNMGYHSSPIVTLLLTLFNARLGAWLGNPADDDRFAHSYPRRQFFPVALAEAFGLTHAKGHYVNLSDGGHFENLGLYELVRRGCGYIIVSDGGCDGSYAFDDLGNAVRKIRVDLGIEVTFHGFRVGWRPKRDGERVAGQYVALGTINYGTGAGRLLYVKPAVFERDEPIDIVQYARANPRYPHEPTSDQWFSESQFESYRALGKYILMAVSGHAQDNAVPKSVGAFFDEVKKELDGQGV